jgi:predicted RND superfamily exporter protein
VTYNVGKTEQAIRITVGAIILLLGIYFRSWWGVIGLVPIITGVTRYCPIYAMLGINTNKVDDKK